MKRLLLILFLIAVLVVSGCSKAECKITSDCPSKTCQKAVCRDKACSYSPIDSCCGNGECEAKSGENECSCATDCGECSAAALNITSSVLDARCIGPEGRETCQTVVKSEEVKIEGMTGSLGSTNLKIGTTIKYENPFNVKNNSMKIDFELVDMASQYKSPRITKITLLGIDVTSRSAVYKPLMSKEVNKYMWNVGDKISEELFMTDYSAYPPDFKYNLKLEVSYEYMRTSYNGVEALEQAVPEKIDIIVPNPKATDKYLTFINPPLEYKCMLSRCNDNNPGTRDVCVQGTFFCDHIPLPNVCGNFLCDKASGENQCTCAKDCGGCSGLYGTYLEMKCSSSNLCVASLKEPAVTLRPQYTKMERYFTTTSYATLKNPFNINTDSIKINLRLDDISGGIIFPIKITNIDVVVRGNTIATYTPASGNQMRQVYDNLNFEIVPKNYGIEISSLEEKSDIEYIVRYEHDYDDGRGVQTRRSSMGFSLGEIYLVDVDA